MKTEVKVNDAEWQKLRKKFKTINKRYVTAGLHKEEAGSGTPNNVEKGIFNEFGTENIPARPFISATAIKQRKKWLEKIRLNLNLVLVNRISPQQFLDNIGKTAAGDIKKYVIELSTPPNAPRTIAKKGFDDPLIETGEMRDAISHKARK